MAYRTMDAATSGFTDTEQRRLTLRAATVFERAALLPLQDQASSDPPSTPVADDVRAVWRAWVQAFSPGDPDALERRLAWDALDVAHLTRALADHWLPERAAPWVAWVDALAVTARVVGRDRAALVHGDTLPEHQLFDSASTLPVSLAAPSLAPSSAPSAAPPFLDLLIPLLRVVREARQRDLGLAGHLDLLTPAAWASLDRHLAREAGVLAELAWFNAFHVARSTRALSYDAFVQEMLERQYAAFLVEHAVLARQLACVARRSVAASVELVARLAADRDVIAETFTPGRAPGVVVDIGAALSDPHAGGRRVCVLRFAPERSAPADLTIVYKPHSVRLEEAFGRWLRWAAAQGLEDVPRTPRVIDRGEYGWVEHVAQDSFSRVGQVQRYFRQSGSLLALAGVLGARDLHMENVIATRDGPVVVDLELLLQPERAPARTVEDGATALAPTIAPDDRGDDFLASGLLTFVVSRDGERFDIGGLRGTGEGVAARPRRTWHDVGCDAMHYAEEPRFRVRVDNRVVLNGVVQMPEAHAEAVLDGFTRTYQFLLGHQQALLATESSLSVFAGARTRVLPRPTVQYGTLLHVVARPATQKDGRRWSVAHEALNRAFNRSTIEPPEWQALTVERHALEDLDVPYFTVDVDGTVLHAADVDVPDYFARSGVAAVGGRVRRLSSTDLAVQRDRLACALSQHLGARFQLAPPAHSTEAGSPDVVGGWREHALWIAGEMLARSTGDPFERSAMRGAAGARGAIARASLYDGTLGPAVFLAAVAAVAGHAAYADAARRHIDRLRIALSPATTHGGGLGAASGLGSMIYGLTVAGSLLGDAAPLELARTLAQRIDEPRLASTAIDDVQGGVAGALLALLALARATSDASLLGQARLCGDRLVQMVALHERGARSNTPVRLGFAHGAAGVAYALGQLSNVAGEARYADAARACWRVVDQGFSTRDGNWPVAVSTQGAPQASMFAWCHGAPGVLLAAALGGPALRDDEAFEHVALALQATMHAPTHPADHVCCGNFGRVEALATTGRCLMRRDAIEAAHRLAGATLVRARAVGHFSLGAGAFDFRVFDAGFFRGLSGIGYSLLRLAAPDRLPSVLAFEPPPAAPGASSSPTPN